MRWSILLAPVLLLASCQRSATAPAPAAVAAAPAPRGDDDVQVIVNGAPSGNWNAARLQKVAPLKMRNNEGQDRVAWPLRDVTRTLVGGSARVVALVNDAQERVAVAPTEWNDPTRTLVMRPSHRGGYKVHWVDADGSSGDALLKGVRKIEIVQ